MASRSSKCRKTTPPDHAASPKIPHSSLLFLPFGPEPNQRHQGQSVDEKYGGEAGIDCAKLLDHDLEVDVGNPAATVLLGNEAGGEPQLVAFDIRAFDRLESPLGIGILVRGA